MAIVNQFMVEGDFWSGMVEPDCRDQTSHPADLRLALHCAISLFHMSDWPSDAAEALADGSLHPRGHGRRIGRYFCAPT